MPKRRLTCISSGDAMWKIRPSTVQPDASSIDKTHEREVPLPFAIELEMEKGKVIHCRYLGHGQIKVSLLLEHTRHVLKVSHADDQEPRVCQELFSRSNGEQLCPVVYEISNCLELDASGQFKQTWLAWTVEYTPAVNNIFQLPEVDRQACLISALYVQARCAQLGLLLSDNSLLNFGMIVHSDGVGNPAGSHIGH